MLPEHVNRDVVEQEESGLGSGQEVLSFGHGSYLCSECSGRHRANSSNHQDSSNVSDFQWDTLLSLGTGS